MVDCTECRFSKTEFEPGTLVDGKRIGYVDTFVCMITGKDISNYDEIECEYFEEHRTCDSCRHCKEIVYETGTIDSIDYHCRLQNDKMIYSDTNAYNMHNYDFPLCSIGEYERLEDMKEYLLVCERDDFRCTTLKITACNIEQAMCKAYSYFGGDSRLKVEEFSVLADNCTNERLFNIFETFVDCKIIYLAECSEMEYVCNVDEVDIIRCK